jgi:hypothetical protein
LHLLSAEELQRMRLTTVDTLFSQKPPAISTTTPPSPMATVGHPSGD